MSEGYVIALIGLGGSLILAIVAILNLQTSRKLLSHVSVQIDLAEKQAEMKLIRNAFVEMSEFLKIFVDKPHLRPFFFDGKEIPTGDDGLDNEVRSLAEWILTNFATAVSLAVLLPKYPIGALKETIKFHLQHSPAMQAQLRERFSGYPVTGLTLLRWRFNNRQEALAELERYRLSAHHADNHAEAERISQLMDLLSNSPEDADLRFAAHGLAASRAGEVGAP